MRRINPVLFSLPLFWLNCARTPTQDFLDLKFINPTTISLFAPATGATATPGVTFSFSTRTGIGSYRLQLSATKDFSGIIFEKYGKTSEITVSSTEFAYEPQEYFWRVGDTNLKYLSETRSIQVISPTTVYVNPSFTGSTQVGNKSAPFVSIQSAISDAALRRSSATQAMEILVSRDGAENGTTDDIQMQAAIALRGGYNAANNWERNIAANTTTIRATLRRAVSFESDVTTALTATSLVEGFTIEARSVFHAVSAIYVNGGSPTITNCIIRAVGVSQTTDAIRLVGGSARIYGNVIEVGQGSYGYGIYASGTAGVQIFNNAISAYSSQNVTYGIAVKSSPGIAITNNTILCADLAPGAAYICPTISVESTVANKPLITNNLLIPLMADNLAARSAIYEEFYATSTPGSLENNFIVNAGSSAIFYTYRRFSPLTTYTDLTFEAITAWTSGSDKARGNVLATWPPTGVLTDLPFQASLSHLPMTTNGGSASNVTFTVNAGNAANLANGDIVDLNVDSIARKISCAGACGTTITFTPPVAGTTSVGLGTVIRVFRNNAIANNCYTDPAKTGKTCMLFDYRPKRPTAATNAEWDTLRYGGKNTALDVCGEPTSGPGVGAGSKNCGLVTTDSSGTARTATVPGGATPSNAAYAAGVSMGAFESD